MKTTSCIKSVKAQGLLSYGPTSPEVPLQQLNVLIGPNGSGKSNLLDLFEILRSLPSDLQDPFKLTGGFSQWVWKGTSPPSKVTFAVEVALSEKGNLQHAFELSSGKAGVMMFEEDIKRGETILCTRDLQEDLVYSDPMHGKPNEEVYSIEDADYTQSLLSQIKNVSQYVGLTSLGSVYSSIQLYRGWHFNRHCLARQPQPSDTVGTFLARDASNLSAVLNELLNLTTPRQAILAALRRFNPGIEDLRIRPVGSSIQMYLYEEGLLEGIPALRFSDGTMHFLALLSILCHPRPPRVICIEDPETGLHPDVMPVVAELLKEACSRTQILLTTHSDALVSALTSVPEAILVCQRTDQGTDFRRLDPRQLKGWLEDYTLGDLWRKGEIGGTL